MTDRRMKDQTWSIDTSIDGRVSHADVRLAVLMDIRDELKSLNRVIQCQNFLEIPRILREIRLKLPTKKRKSR